MGFKASKLSIKILIACSYPVLYITWINLITDTWVKII